MVAVAAIVVADDPPPYDQKARVARWLAHKATYGVLSTTSTQFGGVAFGNTQSFADGTVQNSTGHLFFYISNMDASIQDILVNPRCSFTLSEISTSYCEEQGLDPESPPCARLTFIGKYRNATEAEIPIARAAMFERHPIMRNWSTQGDFHNFHFTTMDLETIWLVDMYGGAAIISPQDYYSAQP
jgi:hypothetical protein